MKQGLKCLAIALLLIGVVTGSAFAQGGATSSITGTVADSGGGVIPGATVVVSTASGTSFTAVTGADGTFTVPALVPGSYKVTVTLQGFKTAVISDVQVAANAPRQVKAVLEVGALSETVTVASSSELVNTQTATVSSTLNADQLNRMPTPTRNALNAVTFLPGVNTTGANRDSSVNGLPDSMVNITLDGVSNNDNFLRTTDGFFASVTPRQDAVEAVTVTSAVSGATMGGSGAVSINFTTRSGTNQLTGSAYEYWRDTSMNTNYWFNDRNGLPKNEIRLNQYGGRIGGPIVIPKVYDGRGTAFYFFHYEQLRFPNSFTRTRTTWHPEALDGNFRYAVSGQTRSVNVMALAAANGQLATYDQTVRNLTALINNSTQKSGVVNTTNNPLLNSYVWQSPGSLFEHQPTLNLTYNLGTKHRLTGSFAQIWAKRDPDYLNGADARFPGAPNYRLFKSSRPVYTAALRSTLSANIVSELRGGITALGGQSAFGDPSSNGPQTYSDIGGSAIVIPLATDWFVENNPSWRSAPTYSIDENITWQRGRHSLNFGGQILRATAWEKAQRMVPSITLGFNNTFDPAIDMFNTTNFPGASTGNLSDARALYAMLTGRVSAVDGQIALDPGSNTYVPFGPRAREGVMNSFSMFAQDSWRAASGLTITAGLRWDLQMPFHATNDTMSAVSLESACGQSGLGDGGTYSKCNFYDPGSNSGVVPQYTQFSGGTRGYDIDYNNIAPSIGVAWQPQVDTGIFRKILGSPEQATIRGGYSESFERQGMSAFTGIYGANPGSTVALSRTANLGNLVLPNESWPILLSQTDRMYQQSFNETPSFPIALRANRADSLTLFAPDLKIASARTWTVGLQRSITRDMAVDIRYVGTYGLNQWSAINYNSRDIEFNGFINEFKLAMGNLQAHVASGTCGATGQPACSFAYRGPGTGTSPLPTYLAYVVGSRDAGNAAAYTGTNWTNTAFTGDMAIRNPSPSNSATDLDGDATRRANALAAGLPANLFVLNPAANAVNVTDSGAFSDYHALQIDLRRRMSRGLSANLNYQYALEGGSSFQGFAYGRKMIPTDDGVRHAIKTQWDWTIPVGRGQRFGANLNPWLDGIVGGWSFNGVGRIQARVVDFGNVNLVGMTARDLQSMYKFDIRPDASGRPTPFMLPDDVIVNTRRAFSLSATSVNGYSGDVPEGRYLAPANSTSCIQIKAGDCAPQNLIIRAPWFTRFDVGVTKKFPLPGRANFELRVDVLNLFDNINFNPVANPGSGETIFQATSAYTDSSNTYDPGGRLGQLMFRINW